MVLQLLKEDGTRNLNENVLYVKGCYFLYSISSWTQCMVDEMARFSIHISYDVLKLYGLKDLQLKSTYVKLGKVSFKFLKLRHTTRL